MMMRDVSAEESEALVLLRDCNMHPKTWSVQARVVNRAKMMRERKRNRSKIRKTIWHFLGEHVSKSCQ